GCIRFPGQRAHGSQYSLTVLPRSPSGYSIHAAVASLDAVSIALRHSVRGHLRRIARPEAIHLREWKPGNSEHGSERAFGSPSPLPGGGRVYRTFSFGGSLQLQFPAVARRKALFSRTLLPCFLHVVARA